MSLDIRLSDLATAVATDIKALRTWITGSSSGTLSGLTTTDKSNIVGAINEVNAKPTSGAPPDASTSVKGILELADLAEVAAGVDTTRAVTVQGVRQERTALKEEILGVGVPEALDTLEELAEALGDDENFAAAVTTQLASIEAELDTKQDAAEIGNANADLVALYYAAKA